MSEFPSDNPSFEQALAHLEKIVRELEDAQIGLDESLERYAHGVGLIKHCHAQLRQAEQKILLLTAGDGEKGPALQSFQHEATAIKSETLRRPRKNGTEELPF